MADTPENKADKELIEQIQRLDLHLDYGSVKIQVRAGKVATITVERTIKIG